MYVNPSLVCIANGAHGGVASLDVSLDTEPSKQKQVAAESAPDQLYNQESV